MSSSSHTCSSSTSAPGWGTACDDTRLFYLGCLLPRLLRAPDVRVEPVVQRLGGAEDADHARLGRRGPHPWRRLPRLAHRHALVPQQADARVVDGIAGRRPAQGLTADVVARLLQLGHDALDGRAGLVAPHRLAEP